jgi:hypothetical protein
LVQAAELDPLMVVVGAAEASSAPFSCDRRECREEYRECNGPYKWQSAGYFGEDEKYGARERQTGEVGKTTKTIDLVSTRRAQSRSNSIALSTTSNQQRLGPLLAGSWRPGASLWFTQSGIPNHNREVDASE